MRTLIIMPVMGQTTDPTVDLPHVGDLAATRKLFRHHAINLAIVLDTATMVAVFGL
jgi:hypothetical protein